MSTTLARRVTRELLGDEQSVWRAQVVATEQGVVAGTGLVRPPTSDPAGEWRLCRRDGDVVTAGEPLMEIVGTPWELAVAEDHAMGVLGVAGGIATHAAAIASAAPTSLRVVCGPWKKWPAQMKPLLRSALDVAGIGHRLLDDEFVYVPKNHVRMLGGVDRAVARAEALDHGPAAVQVVNADEALVAARAGGRVIMLDDGGLDELQATQQALVAAGLRDDVTLAYGGGALPDQLEAIHDAGAEIVDLGRAVLDSPLWDLRMVVLT